jgi:hypothetical protein
MIFLQALWAKVWPYIAVAGAVLAGLFAVRQSGKSAGRAEAERKQTAQALEAIRKSNANREEVARMDGDAQLAEFDRLRDLRRKRRG